MAHRDIVCGDRRWMELAQDRVRWWALLLAVLNFLVLLPKSLESLERQTVYCTV